MKYPPSEGSLELEVKNFGPIAEARIDLRPLTVFVGPSNTGKSYLAILIYALHGLFSDDTLIRRRFPLHDPIRDEEDPPKGAREHLVKWAERTFEDKDKPPNRQRILLPETIMGLIRPLLNESGARGDELALGIIKRCFGTDEARGLIRKASQGGARVFVRKHSSEDSEPFEHKLNIGAKKTSLTATIPETTPIWIDASDNIIQFGNETYIEFGNESTFLEDGPDELSERMAWRLIGGLADDALPCLVAPLHLPAFYLPADRTGIMHSHMALTRALIHSAPMAGLRPAAHTPMLSGVLADFLEQLINLATPRSRRLAKHRRSELGDRIEKAILGGTVQAKKSETDYPYFSYRPEGWESDLPLMNASSMVSELAPVVLYLRYIVRPDNVLIIEEPESHLHPAMQVEFTRQLAAIVRAGVRVIITTHSEWVLEELANIVQRSKLPKTRKKAVESGAISLRPHEVGAWLFEPKNRPRGSVVKEIPLGDSGFFPSGFDEVAVALHNNWAEISSRIGESG